MPHASRIQQDVERVKGKRIQAAFDPKVDDFVLTAFPRSGKGNGQPLPCWTLDWRQLGPDATKVALQHAGAEVSSLSEYCNV